MSTLLDSMTRRDPARRPSAAAALDRLRTLPVSRAARGPPCPTGSGRPRCVVGRSHEFRPLRIGAHVDQTDPIAEAEARDAPLVQFFLGDPQGYKGPDLPRGGAEQLKADAEAAGVDLYVHAPYIVNVATTNNRIRIPSRKLLQQHVDAAASIGAKGLIVHGGHVNATTTTPPRASTTGAKPSRRPTSSCRCSSRTPPAATTR